MGDEGQGQSQGHRREDDSAMAKVTVSCEECGNVQTTKYHSVWRTHLLQEGHQEIARAKVKTMTTKEKKRTIVVFGVSRLKPADLLKHFGDLTFVTNLVFWEEKKDFCIITFLYSRFREAVLKTSHIVNSRKVFLRPLDEIAEVEWISICPFAAREDESPTVKMEMDDSSAEDFSEGTSDEGSDIEAGATASSFRSSGCDGSRERPEGSSPTAIPRDVKPNMSMSSSTLDLGPNSATGQSNPVTPLLIKSEPGTAEEIEIIKSGPQNKVLDTIDIDDSDDDCDRPGIVLNNDTMNLNTGTINSNSRQGFLNRIMEEFYNVNLMPVAEWEWRKFVTSHLQAMLRGLFPNCILIQYGIGSTTLCAEGANLNLYFDINGGTGDRNPTNQHDMNNLTVTQKRQELTKIAKYLKAQYFLHITDLTLTYQNLYVHYTNTNAADGQVALRCRINSSGFLSAQSCRLTNFLFKLDDRVRPLMILTRYWIYHHHFVRSNPGSNDEASDSNFIHPAVMQWIVLFFLIHKKILPTVESLQKKSAGARAPLMLKGDDVSFCDDAQALGWIKKNDYDKNPETENPSSTSVLELAYELFRAFGDEEHIRNSVISPNLGDYISKEDLRSNGSVLQGFEAFEKAKKFLDPKFNNQFILQHPLKPGINVASEVSTKVFQRFQKQCRFTADCLSRLLNSEEIQNPLSLLILPFSENASNPMPSTSSPTTPLTPATSTATATPDDNDNDSDSSDEQIDTQELLGKRWRLPDFTIRLKLEKKKEGKKDSNAGTRQDKRVQEWLDLFEDFNNTVWPVCFGVKLHKLDSTLTAKPGANASFATAFKGVVAKPAVLSSWAYEKQTKTSLQKKITSLSTTLLAETRKKSDPKKPSSKPPNPTNEKLFSFDCQVVGGGWKLEEGKGKKPHGTIDLLFSHVRNQDTKCKGKEDFKTFKKYLEAAYEGLWKTYFLKFSGPQ